MASDQGLFSQQWGTIQNTASSGEASFYQDDLDWLQGAEEMLATFSDGNQQFELGNISTYPDPAVNEVSVLAKREELSTNPNNSPIEIEGVQDGPPKRTKGRPRQGVKQNLTSIEASSLYRFIPF